MLSWPNYLPTFYHRSLTSFNTVVSLRNNYIQCPVPSKGRVLHKRQQLIGHDDTLPLSTYTHSVKIGFSQIITNTITQVWVKEFLQSTQQSHYTQEFNCTHQAERERERENMGHGQRWQLTLNKQPCREQVLCREMENTSQLCSQLLSCPQASPSDRASSQWQGAPETSFCTIRLLNTSDHFEWSPTKTAIYPAAEGQWALNDSSMATL